LSFFVFFLLFFDFLLFFLFPFSFLTTFLIFLVIVFSKTFHCRWFIGDLVTGATGFLGSVHTRSLLSSFSPGDLRILAHPSEDVSFYADLGIDIFRRNLAIPSPLTGIMVDVTTVYHLAAIVVNDSVSREEMFRVNFEGTRALVDAFLRSTSSERFIFSSSLGVYGFSFPPYPIPETFPLNPQNNYHESKMLAERYLLNASSTYGFHASALRNTPIVGPFDTVTFSSRCSSSSYRGCFLPW